MTKNLQAKLTYLRRFGVDHASHGDGSLEGHLLGTHSLLKAWGLRRAVCDSGLFHSVYGTEIYDRISIPPGMRNDVRRMIGAEAETLVWLFSVMSRQSLHRNLHPGITLFTVARRDGVPIEISRQQFRDLIHMLAANDIEQAPRIPIPIARLKIAGLLPFYPYLPGNARIMLDEKSRDLLNIKTRAARPKDFAAIPYIESPLDEIESGGSSKG